MQGKIVMVTGATNGIGKVTARELARKGATVIVVGRSRQKCEETVSMIREKTGNANVSYMVAELSSQKEVRLLASEFLAKYPHLDVLVNNAGALFVSHQESVDGIEMTFALNHLNYFLLTHLLMPALKSAPKARIVNVSSDAQQRSPLSFDDLEFKKGYNGFRAYSQSKLLNMLFTYELARRLADTNITVNALHPGFVSTGFAANNGFFSRIVPVIARIVGVNEDKGAETSIYLASSPAVEGVTGRYFTNSKEQQSGFASYDTTAQERLWDLSEQMVGLKEPVTA